MRVIAVVIIMNAFLFRIYMRKSNFRVEEMDARVTFLLKLEEISGNSRTSIRTPLYFKIAMRANYLRRILALERMKLVS